MNVGHNMSCDMRVVKHVGRTELVAARVSNDAKVDHARHVFSLPQLAVAMFAVARMWHDGHAMQT